MVQEEEADTFLTKASYVFKPHKNEAYRERRLLVDGYLGLVQATIDSISTVSKDYRNLNKDYLQKHIHTKINSILASIYKADGLVKLQQIHVEL